MKLPRTTGPHHSSKWMTKHSGTFAMPVSADNPMRTIYKEGSTRARPDILSEPEGLRKGGPLW